MPTLQQLIEKTKELMTQHNLHIGFQPIIQNYGRDRKGEWVILDGQKYYFKDSME